MPKTSVSLMAMVAAGFLGSCGGSGGTAPPTGGGTPAPSPAPSPSPTPVYTAIPNFTGNQTLQTVSGGIRLRNASNVAIAPTVIALAPFGNDVTLGFTGPGAPFTLSGSALASETFTTADAPAPAPKVNIYSKRDTANALTSQLTIEIPVTTGADLNYSRMIEWFSATDAQGRRSLFALAAVPTIGTDMPQSGVAEFGVLQVRGLAYAGATPGGSTNQTYSLSASLANCVADFGARTVRVQMVLTGTNSATGSVVPLGNYTGDAIIGVGARTFSGAYTLLSPGSMTGTFNGVFSGPQASECGFAFNLSGTFNGQPLVVSGVQAGGRALKREILP